MCGFRSLGRAVERDQRGFTVVEVLTTIILIGIVVAIASSTWSKVVKSRAVDSAANQLVADMRLAHSSSTNQLSAWRFVYNAGGAPVTGCGAGASPPPADYCMFKMQGSTVVKSMPRFLPDDTEMRQTNLIGVSPVPGFVYDRSLEFCPNGSMQTTQNVPVTLSACNLSLASAVPSITVRAKGGNPCHIVRVTPATSRVELVPNPSSCTG